MQCILYKIYFWKVFHMYYNLICIFICTPIWTKNNYPCKKWVLQILPLQNYVVPKLEQKNVIFYIQSI
jgi:hypothetical protein